MALVTDDTAQGAQNLHGERTYAAPDFGSRRWKESTPFLNSRPQKLHKIAESQASLTIFFFQRGSCQVQRSPYVKLLISSARGLASTGRLFSDFISSGYNVC